MFNNEKYYTIVEDFFRKKGNASLTNIDLKYLYELTYNLQKISNADITYILEQAKYQWNVEGGCARSVYLPTQVVDGGTASTMYLSEQRINGGGA